MNRFRSRLEHFNRRRFLGGAGAALVGLPLLESLQLGRAQAADPAHRLLCVGSGSGLPMKEFVPKGEGADYEMPPLFESIAALKDKVSFFSGLGIDEGAQSPGDHGAGVAATFTCATPKGTHANTNKQDYKDPGSAFRLGISFDQVMAQQVGSQTRFPSLQLGLREGEPLGDGPFSPVYLKNLSWASATQPLSPTVDPGVLFDQLFAEAGQQEPAAQRAVQVARSRSVFDYVIAERDHLLPALSQADRERVDQYFTAAREVEERLAVSPVDAGGAGCGAMEAPASGLNYADTFRTMGDLALLALQCDATRVVMLQLSCYRNDKHFDFLDVNDGHHTMSHNGDRGYGVVCRWLCDQLGDLILRLDGVQEPDGTLLDNMLLVSNNDCGDGDSHDHKNLPVLVAGGARGNFPAGRHFANRSNTPCCGLYAAALQSMGIAVEHFGEKRSGPLDLTA